MAVDLSRCTGCQCCVVVCSHTNAWPESTQWRQVPGVELGDGETPRRLFLPLNCMHCDSPPCLEVCPTKATYQRPDGIVGINAALCTGCGYCIVACPYLARSIATAPAPTPFSRTTPITRDVTGICVKCDFCQEKLDAGLAAGLVPGIDRDATPACVNACTSQALFFGDLESSESPVSRFLRERQTVRLHDDLGAKPSVYYAVN